MNEDASQNHVPEDNTQETSPQAAPEQPEVSAQQVPPPGQPSGPAYSGTQYTQSPFSHPTPPPAPNRKWVWPVAVGGGCLLLVIFFFVVIAAIVAGTSGFESGRSGDIALIHVSGIITGGGSSNGVFSGSSAGAEDLISQLERARRNDDIKAIVIRINSPGGSAAGSEEVYNEIMRVRKKKPVYTSMGDVAASGGYYIASASNKIYADASTITGSIGVIFETTDLSNLYKKIGVSPEVIKSGKFKDIGSPARPLTPEEKQLLQGIINSTYEKFVDSVSKGRKLPVADVKKIADGRVFTGTQAQKLKLVDEIGGLHETVRAAAKAAGIKGEPTVTQYERRSLLGGILGDDSDNSTSHIDKVATDRVLRYLLSREEAVPVLR